MINMIIKARQCDKKRIIRFFWIRKISFITSLTLISAF